MRLLFLFFVWGSCLIPNVVLAVMPRLLSETGVYEISHNSIKLASDYTAYSVDQNLFSDYALKWRAIKLGDSTQIKVDSNGFLIFPEGTILVKTFFYPNVLNAENTTLTVGKNPPLKSVDREVSRNHHFVETRLLVYKAGRWLPFVYLWSQDQSDAVQSSSGSLRLLQISIDGINKKPLHYHIPSVLECADCHGGYNENETNRPLGLTLDQVNTSVLYNGKHVNQLELWKSYGISIAGQHERGDNPGSEDIEIMARKYLHVNCGHCHNSLGLAASSRLFLTHTTKSPFRLGVCKQHVAAGNASLGLTYDIEPGTPERSLLLQRMKSESPNIKMPELGRHWSDPWGIELVRLWIEEMPGSCTSRP